MNSSLKKIFHFFLLKKRVILFISLFILLGIFLPGQTAHAQWQWLINAVTYIPMVTISLVLVILAGLSTLFAGFGGMVLNWVLSSSFIDWSYTKNPIVEIGLSITLPLVNMFLVLILVFIALTTILRLAGYETKKLLPIFILIALLVNFSPVICGLIVDASNILMDFFTSEITGGERLISTLKSVGDALLGVVDWKKFDVKTGAETVLALIVLIGVNFALFLILLLFAFIFMVRYLAIWLLVILSPLAFASYILPATRSFWKIWWNQFIQWSFIGVTMGFFLYLGDQFTMLSNVIAPASGIGGVILPGLVPVVFLYLGFVFGITSGAMGSSQIIGFAKKTGKKYGGKIGKWTKNRGAEYIASSEKVQQIAKKMATAQTPGKRWWTKAAASVPWAVSRKVGHTIGPGLVDSQRKLIEEGEKKLSGKNIDYQVSALRRATTSSQRVAALNAMIKDNNLDDAIDNYGLTREEIENIKLDAKKYNSDKEIVSAMPSAQEIEKIRPQRAGQISKKALEDKEIMKAIANSWDGRHVQSLIQTHGAKGVAALEGAIKNTPDFSNKNPALSQFIKDTAGQRLGFGGGKGDKKSDEFAKKWLKGGL